MTKYITLTLTVLLSGCGGNADEVAADDPTARLAAIVRSYSENGLQAKHTWGGKRVVIGGAFDTAGKSPDGGISVLLNPGPGVGLGVLRFDLSHADFITALKKDAPVTAECTVDPATETIMTTFQDCKPVDSAG